uniref:ELK n=1 Tax=Nematostella vectensis TaxID=45351 RepID=A0A089PG55_NEMVE|nr:ELK [Nematostella vectensis]
MPMRRGRFAPQNTFLETIAQKFDHGNSNFVLGSAQEKNNYPIVYCSDGFCELTGFTRTELMRRTCACNFLYGLETNQEDVRNIQNALKTQKELKKEVIFYRKNGSHFFCLLDIVPIKNEKGTVVLFLVSHKDVTKRKQSGEATHDRDENASGRTGPGERKLTRSRSRKFSRDVLLHLSRQYQQSNSATKPQSRRPTKRSRSFSFTSERLPLYKRETTKKSKLLFLHYSNVKSLWDWWVLILTFYIAIMVPYNVAFSRHGKARDLIIVDMVIELFFILDIVVHFRTTFVNKAGRIVYEQKAIAIHYLKGWFILDFLAALPFEALYFINKSWGFLVQLLKCGRLLRLFRVVRKLHRYTEYSTVLLTLLMLAFAMVAHWLACIWYVIGLEEVSHNSTISWLYQFGETIQMPFIAFSPDTGPDEGSAYVTALYFILTSMTTVGFGNVSANTRAEKAFAVVVMLIGALMHAAIFGNVAAIIQKLYANRVRYHSRSNEIKQFIRVHHIEADLANRLEDCFHTTWSLSGGVDTREILTTFPYELQADVCMHLYRGLLDLPVFSQAPRGLFRMVSLKVSPVYIGPGEYLLTQNDVINSIYYIASGSMEVLQGESVAAILGKGDLFGEDISRKSPIRRSNGDVRALTYCDVYYITRDKLQEVMHLYPDFSYKFSEKLELTYDLGASEKDIWRRGGLDSISEDEEEEEDEATSPETDKENPVTSPTRTRFDFSPKLNMLSRRRSNPLRFANESLCTNKVQNRRPNSLTISNRRPQETQPLLNATPTRLGSHGDMNEEAGQEDSEETALEWEQENFTLKKEEPVEKGMECTQNLTFAVSGEITPSAIDRTGRLETDMGIDSLQSRNADETESSLRLDRDSFIKQLHSCTDEMENRMSRNTSLGDLEEAEECRNDDGDKESSTEDEPLLDSMNSSLRKKRRPEFTRSQAYSTPTPRLVRQICASPGGSSTRSSKGVLLGDVRRTFSCGAQESSEEHTAKYRNNDSPTSGRGYADNLTSDHREHNRLLIEPEDFDCDFPPINNLTLVRDRSIQDTLELKGLDSGCSTPRRKRSISPGCESPYMRKLFAYTPPPHESTEYGHNSHEDVNDLSYTTLNDAPRHSYYENQTPVVSSPAPPEDKPPARRRKVSAVAPPPAIFASLLSQASSPYADFTPPQIVRESPITCDCGEDETCVACRGEKHSDSTHALEDYTTYSIASSSRRFSRGSSENLSKSASVTSSTESISRGLHYSLSFRRNADLNRTNALQEPSDDLRISTEGSTTGYILNGNIISPEEGSIHNDTADMYLANHNEAYQSPCASGRDDPPIDAMRRLEGFSHGESATIDRAFSNDRIPSTHAPNVAPSSEGAAGEVDFCLRLGSSAISDSEEICTGPENNDSKRPGTALNLPFFDGGTKMGCNQYLYNDHLLTVQDSFINTSDISSQSSLSFSPVTSIRSSAVKSTRSMDNVTTDDLPQRYKQSLNTHPVRKPKLSGELSTCSLQSLTDNTTSERPIRISFSEPHLHTKYLEELPITENEQYGDDQLEDIFKDVVSTKEAMERLQVILNSPEPDLCSELTDTKETVKRLDRQVVNLNQDVASLSRDVKTVLEMLKGFRNGQVEPRF